MTEPRVALTIAGSDSGGGAGIQADLRAFAAHEVFGTTAITAVTAQNTLSVNQIHPVPADVIGAQIDAVTSDFAVAACKTGMLATRAALLAVVSRARAGALPNLVVDPVMVSSTGTALIEDGCERLYVEELFRYATVITPNVDEASILCGSVVTTLDERVEAARKLLKSGTPAVVITGSEESVDVIVDAEGFEIMESASVDTDNTHGTGCTYSAAITAMLARGSGIREAVKEAKAYVASCLDTSKEWRLGSGSGPADCSASVAH